MRRILITTILITILIFMALLSGCSINSSIETLTIPLEIDGQKLEARWDSEIWQGLFLYFTKTKKIDHRTGFSSLTIGEIESIPDANSIEAVTEAAVRAAIKAMIP